MQQQRRKSPTEPVLKAVTSKRKEVSSTDREAALHRGRNTTVYGNTGKRAQNKRIKEVGRSEGAAKTVPPTKEWLLREGAKLTEAASGESFSFFDPLPPAATQEERLTEEKTLLNSTSALTDGAPLARPKRAKPCDSATSEAKKTRLSVLEPLSSKSSMTV